MAGEDCKQKRVKPMSSTWNGSMLGVRYDLSRIMCFWMGGLTKDRRGEDREVGIHRNCLFQGMVKFYPLRKVRRPEN